jgi:cation diffusion facilitator CzcD-associated flavoprotein CzcO
MTDAATDKRKSQFAFDPEALRKKYLEERDKRLRPHGSTQFIALAGDYAPFADDPHADPEFDRAPLVEDIDVAVLGGGITGLLTAAQLRGAGLNDFRVFDKAADFGGTWYWNRYPGVRCDVEAYIYMPLLEELGYVPSEKYAKGSEIFSHLKAIGRHFDLYDQAIFQTQVLSITWDDDLARWIVRTDRDDVIRARFVTLGSGPISKPKLPGIPGIHDFKGKMFHTARWDYDYTGGSPNGDLTGLADKRVAVIGTGATGVQVIPHVGAIAKETLVIQRTPAAVDLRENRATDASWAQSLESGWQKRRVENFSAILIGMQVEEDLVADRWTDVFGRLSQWSVGKYRPRARPPRPCRADADGGLRKNGGNPRPHRPGGRRPGNRGSAEALV